jgi:flavodoxin
MKIKNSLITLVILLIAMLTTLATSSKDLKESKMNNIKKEESKKDMKTNKMLVVYFSHSGNTRIIAEKIKNATGSDIFEIIPVKPYPKDYKSVVDQADKEISENFKPELNTKIQNIDQYDVIFVGSPCWWATYPPPVATFLSSYNLSRKTIVPFMTHEGSGMAHTVADIKKLCPKSIVLEGLPIRGSLVNNAQDDLMKWLHKIKLIK